MICNTFSVDTKNTSYEGIRLDRLVLRNSCDEGIYNTGLLAGGICRSDWEPRVSTFGLGKHALRATYEI